MIGFRSFNNSACQSVAVGAGYLRLREIIVKRVTVIKFGVNAGSGDRTGCDGIDVSTDTAKLMKLIIARFGER